MNWKKRLGVFALVGSLLTSFSGIIMIVMVVVIAITGSTSNDKTHGMAANSEKFVQTALAEEGYVGGAKFWSWIGFDNYVAWCAAFVSWCADQCGYIENGIFPKSALCMDYRTYFEAKGQWKDGWAYGGNYKPKRGDLILFDWQGNDPNNIPDYDHIGIVLELTEVGMDTVITTVEGNSSDSVTVGNTYLLTDRCVIGYCVPDYPISNINGGGIISNNSEDLDLLSRIIYHEAGSDFICNEEQLMVGSVVLNRVASPEFPNTIREVLFQAGQYAPTLSPDWDTTVPNERAVQNAEYLLRNGSIAPENVVYQALFTQGSGVYNQFYHPELNNTTYFCYR